MTARRVARPEVLRRVPLGRHAVIEASAGTGKTFTLEHMVVELLLATDVAVDRLLIVTFTEKATHELRGRVRSKIEELSSGRGELATARQIQSGDFWTLDEPARGRLARALHALDGAAITTIHAFCQRVLRENAFAGGRLFEEQQVDAREAFGRALRDVLRQELAADPERSRWIEAALGGGFTLSRIEELLWKCATARAELRPEFDAPMLAAALDAFPIEEARRPEIVAHIKSWGAHASTAKAIARRLYALADRVEATRKTNDVPRYVADAKDIDFGELLDKLRALAPRGGPGTRLRSAAMDLARATPPFQAALVRMILPALVRTLTRGKREAGRYDFDDMLALVDETLRGPRAGVLADSMRRRFRHVFIDEFQDTDETQWAIFRRAFYERTAGDHEPPSRVVLIGDPKQSIYRFRGADVQTYLRARSDVLASGGPCVPLERNYRASRALVDATNAIFDPEAKEPLFTGSIAYAPVECGRPERQLVDGGGIAVSPVHVLRFHGEIPLGALGDVIAREIRSITDPVRPFRLDGRPITPRDILVLTRTAREGLLIGAKLREARVPHASYKEEGLYQSEEANDVRAILSAIDDPRDRACRLSAWMTPFFGLPLSEVEHARDLPDAHPFVERLDGWKYLADRRDFERLFESIARESGILRREIFFASGERSLTNYLHLFELLVDRARVGHKTLSDLVCDLSGLKAKTKLPLDLEGNVQRLESESSAVQIMTIHKAKGLEAAVVFVAGGLSQPRGDDPVRVYHEGGRRMAYVGSPSPGVKDAVKVGEREEDQRLMYVALTRAMGRLYLPCVVDAMTRGKRGPYEPVNRRVVELIGMREPTLTVEDILVHGPPGAPAAPPIGSRPAESETSPAWRPPMDLLRKQDDGAVYDALRSRHAGAVITSYTRMKAKRTGARGGWIGPAEDRREEAVIERVGEALAVPGVPPLRSARASGIFLHELLERIPIVSFAASTSMEAWRSRADVMALVAEAMAVHRVEPAQRDHAERLVWGAYMTPLVLPGGHRIDGLASTGRVAREMEFVFPTSSREVAPGAEATARVRGTPRPKIARHGYVRGSLDLALEHRGLTYVVDWKSDTLPSYAREAVAYHVADHYEEQLRLYVLAIVKLLGVASQADYDARFGGFLYCFLRGFDAQGGGLWFVRPAFHDLLGWDEDLRCDRAWAAGKP
jgi:exodeoxyribonuclease V beta subunit